MSSIYITGDCHADFHKFNTANFSEQKNLTKNDYVIICGDFGIWHDNPEEWYNLNWLNNKSFTTLFVDGNHENFDRLYSDEFETVDFCGGKAHKIRNSVYHLQRGYVFNIAGKKIFAFGGASSHDIQNGILEPDDFKNHNELYKKYQQLCRMGKMVRINHQSWWKEEIPNADEMQRGLQSLKENDFKVDYIVSHCCPQHVASLISQGEYKTDALTKYFNEIDKKTKFTKWFCGHYHINQNVLNKYVILYEQIIQIQ